MVFTGWTMNSQLWMEGWGQGWGLLMEAAASSLQNNDGYVMYWEDVIIKLKQVSKCTECTI